MAGAAEAAGRAEARGDGGRSPIGGMVVFALGALEQKQSESPSTASQCSPLSSSSSTSHLDGSASSSSSRALPARSMMRTSSLGVVGRHGRGTIGRVDPRLEGWAPVEAKTIGDQTWKSEGPVSRPASRGSSKGLGGSVSRTSGFFHPENAEVLKVLRKAKRVGVGHYQLHQTEKLLNEEHESQELARVAASGNARALRATFHRAATQAGVEKKRVEVARKTITECEVFEMLEKSIAAEDSMALQFAIQQAKRANLPREDIEAAEKVVVGIEARSRLKAALECTQIESVKWALQDAEKTCMETKLYQEAQRHLNRLEMLKDLEAAISKKDCYTIGMCLQDALDAGLEGPEVDRATAFCAQMEAREAQRCPSRESDPGVRFSRATIGGDVSPTASWALQKFSSESSALQVPKGRMSRRTVTLSNVRASTLMLRIAGSNPSSPRRSQSKPRATMLAMSAS